MISFLFHTSSGDFLNGSYCSFEDGDCSWKPIAGRTLSWKRLQSPAKTSRQSCPSSGGERASLVISGAYKTLAYLQTLLSANASLEPPEGKFYMKATTYIFGDFNDLEYLILTAVATYPNLWCHRHWFWAALWYKQNPAESKRCSVSTLHPPTSAVHPQSKDTSVFHFAEGRPSSLQVKAQWSCAKPKISRVKILRFQNEKIEWA